MSFTVNTEPRDDRQLAVIIEVSSDRVERELRKAASKVARNYRFPGFRPGKAPYHIVVQQFGLANLYNEFVEDLGQEVFEQALKQEQIQPYGQAALEDIQLEPRTYKLVVPLEPEIELGDYRSLRLEEIKPAVDEDEVTRRVEALRDEYAGWQDVERPSDYGDMLTIDVKSVIAPAEAGGEETVVLNETDWDVTPDQENPMEPPGFDQELVGLKAGDEKTFVLSWPVDGQSIYAGKAATFNVKVKGVQAYEKPALNDDFAKLVSSDVETIDELTNDIRESIEANEKSRVQDEFITQALDAVVDMSTLNYPPIVIEDQLDSMLADTEQRLRQMGIDSLETFLRQSNQELPAYREMLRPAAIKIARRNLVISELVKSEQLKVTQEEVEARIRLLVGLDGDGEPDANAEAMAEMLRHGSGLTMMISQILTQKTLERLLAIVRGEEVPALGAGDEAPAGDAAIEVAAVEVAEVAADEAE
ncbi:MAG: trigger factor [Anaerolineales bacterium]|nr:trigger factor [Anaerolineales bacterium]